MNNILNKLQQDATYWYPTGSDLFNKQTFGRATIKCRWEDVSEVFIDKTGKEATSKSVIFFAENIDIEGYVFLGESLENDPTLVPGAHMVKQVSRIPDLRNLKTLYTVYL